MTVVSSAVLGTASTEAARSTVVTLGTRYPADDVRQPAPATGSVKAVETGAIRIRNATAGGEVGDYRNGGEWTAETTELIHRGIASFGNSHAGRATGS